MISKVNVALCVQLILPYFQTDIKCCLIMYFDNFKVVKCSHQTEKQIFNCMNNSLNYLYLPSYSVQFSYSASPNKPQQNQK